MSDSYYRIKLKHGVLIIWYGHWNRICIPIIPYKIALIYYKIKWYILDKLPKKDILVELEPEPELDINLTGKDTKGYLHYDLGATDEQFDNAKVEEIEFESSEELLQLLKIYNKDVQIINSKNQLDEALLEDTHLNCDVYSKSKQYEIATSKYYECEVDKEHIKILDHCKSAHCNTDNNQ